MQKNNKKRNIIILVIAVILIVGIAITFTKGLNFDLRFQETKKVEVSLQKDFEISDIRKITDEVIPNQYVIIQKVEVYEDAVSIIAKDITDEQKANLITKLNEKYQIELSADSTEILSVPHTRGRDIIKPYIIPFTIATAIILVYMMLRYHKLGSIKILLKTVGITILAQAMLLSIIAITQIPIGRLTIPMVITVYLLTLVGLTTKFEKNLENKKLEEKKD